MKKKIKQLKKLFEVRSGTHTFCYKTASEPHILKCLITFLRFLTLIEVRLWTANRQTADRTFSHRKIYKYTSKLYISINTNKKYNHTQINKRHFISKLCRSYHQTLRFLINHIIISTFISLSVCFFASKPASAWWLQNTYTNTKSDKRLNRATCSTRSWNVKAV